MLRFRRLTMLAALIVASAPSAAVAGAALVETKVLSAEAPAVRVAPGGTVTFTLTLDIKPSYHTMAYGQENPTALAAGETPFAVRVAYPEGHDFTLLAGEPPIKVYSGRTPLGVTLTAPASAAEGRAEVPLVLSYQACNETTCLLPEKVPLKLAVEVVGGAAVEAPPEVTPAVEPTATPAVATGRQEESARAQLDWAYEHGLGWMLVIVFGFGLALNVTPCVFPLLPVTMGFFASQGEGRPSRTFPMALLYVLSMAAVFTALGVAAALAGGQIGFFLGSLAGRVIIAAIMALLAASLFGAFEIHLPLKFLSKMQGKRGWIGAVFMGLAVGLIAAPCVGPLVSALVAFVAQEKDVALGAGLFFTLALGMGLPYLVLGVFTGLINRVPHGGGYLIWFRRVLAFPLLAMVVYFLRADMPRGLVWTLYAAVALGGAVYLGVIEGWTRQPWSHRFVAARVATAILLAAAATAAMTLEALPEWGLAGAPLETALAWQALEDGSLERAASDGAAAVVYFNGKPCPYCDIMDRRTFRGDEVIASARGVRLLKRDVYESVGGRAGELKKELNIAGPPRLLFFDRSGKLVADRSGVVTRAEFLELLKKIQPPHG